MYRSAAALVGFHVLVASTMPSPTDSTLPTVSPATTLRFAESVAIAGDELLVGRVGVAARPDAQAGGVHIFRRESANHWTEQAVLTPRDLAWGDGFGAALAVDGNLLAVGAPMANGQRGAVYLFERDGNGRWVERAKLAPTSADVGDHIGTVLALRDGILLAGAPDHAENRGQVTVFRRGASAAAWTEQTELINLDMSHMAFGRALAVANGRVFVGAPGPAVPTREQQMPDASPQVFIFRDSAGRWVPERSLTPPPDASAEGAFGAALLADSADLWIGSPSQNGGDVVHFRRGRGGQLTEAGRLTAAAPEEAHGFGAALARDGRDLLIGAPGTNNTGAVYAFRYDSARGNWVETPRVMAIDTTIPFRRHTDKPVEFGGRLAVGNGLALVGLPSLDNMEGVGVILSRDGASGEWRQVSTLIDTAWTTRQSVTGGEVPCRGGRAKIFGCQNADLVAFLPLGAIGGDKSGVGEEAILNVVWGWTDSTTGREFAIVGRHDGAAFVEVTDPVNPRYLGELPRHQGTSPTVWRDLKVYKNHLFVVAGGAGLHGMQVFDLTQLRDVKEAPAVFKETAHYDRLGGAHTLALNEETGYAYAVLVSDEGETCGRQLHMIDVRDPVQPKFAGCYFNSNSNFIEEGTHETVCVVYRGPDKRYTGREICLNADGENGLDIVDVTDKQRPKAISAVTYPNAAYTHQGWFSEDQRYFFVNDEFDEGVVFERAGLDSVRTRTIIFDMTDLSDPVMTKEYYGSTAAVDHNLYIRGRYMYQSNYTAGLRIIDIVDPKNPKEVGYFGTAPAFEHLIGTAGNWSNYPFFKSGVVAATSQGEGLFLIRFRPPAQ